MLAEVGADGLGVEAAELVLAIDDPGRAAGHAQRVADLDVFLMQQLAFIALEAGLHHGGVDAIRASAALPGVAANVFVPAEDVIHELVVGAVVLDGAQLADVLVDLGLSVQRREAALGCAVGDEVDLELDLVVEVLEDLGHRVERFDAIGALRHHEELQLAGLLLAAGHRALALIERAVAVGHADGIPRGAQADLLIVGVIGLAQGATQLADGVRIALDALVDEDEGQRGVALGHLGIERLAGFIAVVELGVDGRHAEDIAEAALGGGDVSLAAVAAALVADERHVDGLDLGQAGAGGDGLGGLVGVADGAQERGRRAALRVTLVADEDRRAAAGALAAGAVKGGAQESLALLALDAGAELLNVDLGLLGAVGPVGRDSAVVLVLALDEVEVGVRGNLSRADLRLVAGDLRLAVHGLQLAIGGLVADEFEVEVDFAAQLFDGGNHPVERLNAIGALGHDEEIDSDGVFARLDGGRDLAGGFEVSGSGLWHGRGRRFVFAAHGGQQNGHAHERVKCVFQRELLSAGNASTNSRMECGTDEKTAKPQGRGSIPKRWTLTAWGLGARTNRQSDKSCNRLVLPRRRVRQRAFNGAEIAQRKVNRSPA